MKQSHLYQNNTSKSIKRVSSSINKDRNISQLLPALNSFNQTLLQSAFKVMQLLITNQQKIQLYKQLLTSKSDFNPQSLFYYISRNQPLIDKKNILQVLEENNIFITDQNIKLYLNSYGYKEKIDYSAFVNLIFPVDVQLLKYISVTGIKKYSNQLDVTQQVLATFLFLVKSQINLIQSLDTYKNGSSLNKTSRKDIKNIMRIMKKNGQCNSQMQIQSQPYVKYEELKLMFKNLVNNNTKTSFSSKKTSLSSDKSLNHVWIQKNLSCVFRKISMGKANFINLEDMEFWLKPWANNNYNVRQKPQTFISGIQQDMNNQGFSSSILSISNISKLNQIGKQSNVSLKQNIQVPLSHQIKI